MGEDGACGLMEYRGLMPRQTFFQRYKGDTVWGWLLPGKWFIHTGFTGHANDEVITDARVVELLGDQYAAELARVQEVLLTADQLSPVYEYNATLRDQFIKAMYAAGVCRVGVINDALRVTGLPAVWIARSYDIQFFAREHGWDASDVTWEPHVER